MNTATLCEVVVAVNLVVCWIAADDALVANILNITGWVMVVCSIL